MKYIKKIEKFGLKNITGISIFLITCILFLDLIPYFFLEKINLLSTTNTLTFLGAIFAFWYGYKKYERDKEIEILEKYTKKYNYIDNALNNLKGDLKHNINNENKSDSNIIRNKIKKEYENLFNLFYEEFYLKSKGYISDELWKEWESWIELDIFNFLNYSIYTLFNTNDEDIFISHIMRTYLKYHGDGKDKIRFEGLSYLEFIIKILSKIKSDIDIEIQEKKFNNDYKKLEDLSIWIDIIIKNTNQTISKSVMT